MVVGASVGGVRGLVGCREKICREWQAVHIIVGRSWSDQFLVSLFFFLNDPT